MPDQSCVRGLGRYDFVLKYSDFLIEMFGFCTKNVRFWAARQWSLDHICEKMGETIVTVDVTAKSFAVDKTMTLYCKC